MLKQTEVINSKLWHNVFQSFDAAGHIRPGDDDVIITWTR